MMNLPKLASHIQEVVLTAIRREQAWLKRHQSSAHSDLTVVRQYEEAWIQFAIVKEFVRDPHFRRLPLKLTAEYTTDGKRADISLYDRSWGQRPKARIELKGPAQAKPKLVKDILSDCHKLSRWSPKAKVSCVVGLAYGSQPDICDWTNKARRALALTSEALQVLLPKPIRLGKVDGSTEYLQVVIVTLR